MDDTPQSIDKLITLAKQDRRELLNFYIGWRVWKKGNNIVFNQKREHIVKVIHDAIRDWNQWEEANNCLNQRNTENERSNDEAIQCHQTTPSSAQYYCQVDASWKNSLEVAGIGWSLHSMQGNQLLQRSTSIRATNSPREAEAEALRIAKLKRISAENFRRPKTLAVELSLSPVSSLSSLSSLPPPRRCRVVVVVVVAADWWWWSDLAALLFPCSKSVQISFPLPLVSRSGSRSRLRLIDHVYR
ncbi:hypothetical protein F2Q70_00009983 [Brassica cretica]|nr:hypothetical protein F2Q70_00009983 [Brassica cretica]